MERTKNALQLLLRSLPRKCKFDVVSFGSTFQSAFGKSRDYTADSFMAAIRLVEVSIGLSRHFPWLLTSTGLPRRHG